MDNKTLRIIYDTMLDSGDLDEVMPGASGIWEKDKLKFNQIQEDLDKSVMQEFSEADLESGNDSDIDIYDDMGLDNFY